MVPVSRAVFNTDTGSFEGFRNTPWGSPVVTSGGRNALQSGTFSLTPETPLVYTQGSGGAKLAPFVLANPALMSVGQNIITRQQEYTRLGSEAYGGGVQLNTGKTLGSAYYGMLEPPAMGNLANLAFGGGAESIGIRGGLPAINPYFRDAGTGIPKPFTSAGLPALGSSLIKAPALYAIPGMLAVTQGTTMTEAGIRSFFTGLEKTADTTAPTFAPLTHFVLGLPEGISESFMASAYLIPGRCGADHTIGSICISYYPGCQAADNADGKTSSRRSLPVRGKYRWNGCWGEGCQRNLRILPS